MRSCQNIYRTWVLALGDMRRGFSDAVRALQGSRVVYFGPRDGSGAAAYGFEQINSNLTSNDLPFTYSRLEPADYFSVCFSSKQLSWWFRVSL
jgi:hypothetical protein